jgi:hypothetical protein
MELNEMLSGVVKVKACKISADEDGKKAGVHKVVNLSIDYSGLTVNQLLEKCMKADVISWQNGQGRPKYNQWKDGQTVSIKASAPAATQVDIMAEMRAKFASCKSQEERDLLIAELTSAKV